MIMPSATTPLPGESRGYVAVVDDDFRILESLGDLLNLAGYKTLLSASAEEFLQSPDRKDVDVLISDIGLPGLNGLDLVRTLRRQSECPPAILLTGRNEAYLEEEAEELAVARLLIKPFDTEELLGLVQQQLKGAR
jgi:DNA-binding response OmpR family regulator